MTIQPTRLAKWSKANVWKARFLQIALMFLLAILALEMGALLQGHECFMPIEWVLFPFGLFVISVIHYPTYSRCNKKNYYQWRELGDASLLISGYLFWLMVGNHFTSNLQDHSTNAPQPVVLTALKRVDVSQSKTLSFFESQFRWGDQLVEKYKSAKKRFLGRYSDEESKPGLGILLVLLSLISFFLAWDISCSIACAGSTVLGWIVFFGGMVGAAALMVIGFKKLFPDFDKKIAWIVSLAVMLITSLVVFPSIFGIDWPWNLD